MEFKFNFFLKQFSITLILSYIFLLLFLYLNQTNLLFFPNTQDFNNCKNLNYAQNMEINNSRFYYYNHENTKINESDNLIVFYHGNAGSACDRFQIANNFKNLNYSFIIVEYPSYSNDTNTKLSKKLLFENTKTINNFIKNQIKPNNLILGSESMGSALLSYHNSISKPNKIFLINPYDKLENLVQQKRKIIPAKLLLKYDFNNIKYLKNYSNELIIFHGELDNIIPISFSKNLFNQINSTNKNFISYPNLGHNNIQTSNFYVDLNLFLTK